MEDELSIIWLFILKKKLLKNLSSYSIIDELKNMKKQMTIFYICVISFIVMFILNYVFIIFALVTIIKYIFWVYYFDSPNNIGQDATAYRSFEGIHYKYRIIMKHDSS